MSKYLNIPNGDYQIKVQSGGTIRLDTGIETGEVRISGDLIVEGNTTTVESEEMLVKDNMIELNSGDTGTNGITLNKSGLSIDRGANTAQYPIVEFVFDENVEWNDPVTQTNISGGFVFRQENGKLLGLRTPTVSTGGVDLFLDFNSGAGVVRVVNSSGGDYTSKVTEDDILTNKKYVDEAIVAGIQGITIKSIQQGDSKVELFDDSIEAVESNFNIEINGLEVARFEETQTFIEDIVIQNNRIETSSTGDDLTLASFGSGSVSIDGVLKLPNQLTDPSASTGVILYGKEPGLGKTGLYFVNSNDNSGEVVSRNRSLLYSMIF
jgi:hypothetical protein